jgi:hypothetical protein
LKLRLAAEFVGCHTLQTDTLLSWVIAAGVKLEPEQIQKIEAEASVVAEIKDLGGTV